MNQLFDFWMIIIGDNVVCYHIGAYNYHGPYPYKPKNINHLKWHLTLKQKYVFICKRKESKPKTQIKFSRQCA
jgi:hypothetical protein